MTINAPLAYDLLNDSTAKPLVYVLKIRGLSYIIGSGTINERIYYGMPGLEYGMSFDGDPVVYGGLIPFGGLSSGAADPTKQKPYLNLDKGGLILSQKVEPWEGKASVSLMDFNLTDINSEMLELISPGITLDEILLKRVELFIGFENTGFQAEFIRIYRGIVSGVRYEPGLVTLKTSDPNLLRRQKLFEKSQTTLTSGINNSVTTIPVVSTDGFFQLINAPGSGSPEVGHQVGIKIDDEIITYTANPGATDFTSVTRGALGSVASAHSSEAEVTPVFYFEGNALRVALKLMLSGWAGTPSETAVDVKHFENTGDSGNPLIDNGIIFGVDVKDEYGIEEGDFVTTSGASNGANNFTERQILSFFSVAGAENRGIVVAGAALVEESDSAAVASFRSQYDVYPEECGLKMQMYDVDVRRHKDTADQFVIDEVATLTFTVTDESDSGKEFIEKELYLPVGGFSLTRQGKCSVVITAPPLPLSSVLTLNTDNVIDADKAILERAVNNRRFYNRVDFSYDHDAIEDSFVKYEKYIDSDSLNQIPYKEYLQIESKGMRTANNAVALIERITRRLFERYAFAAQTITFKVNWQVGALLEAGDIIILDDQGVLQFPDLSTGQRGLPLQLWEILEKSTDLKTAQTSLTIINGLGVEFTDRFGVISPSSEIDSGISQTQFRIETESFGALFPGQEFRKWEDYIGLNVIINSPSYSYYAEAVLTDIDASDQFKLTVAPALGFTPAPGDIISLAPYSNSADPNDQALAKIQHCFLSPKDEVSSGTSGTVFTATTPSEYWVGASIVVHSEDYTTMSDEVLVTNITGSTITVDTDLGFTPNNTHVVTFIGFSADETQTYRWYS